MFSLSLALSRWHSAAFKQDCGERRGQARAGPQRPHGRRGKFAQKPAPRRRRRQPPPLCQPTLGSGWGERIFHRQSSVPSSSPHSAGQCPGEKRRLQSKGCAAARPLYSRAGCSLVGQQAGGQWRWCVSGKNASKMAVLKAPRKVCPLVISPKPRHLAIHVQMINQGANPVRNKKTAGPQMQGMRRAFQATHEL